MNRRIVITALLAGTAVLGSISLSPGANGVEEVDGWKPGAYRPPACARNCCDSDWGPNPGAKFIGAEDYMYACTGVGQPLTYRLASRLVPVH